MTGPGEATGLTVERLVSAGLGSTEVWQAVRADGSLVALKLYLPDEDAPEAALRFRGEAELLARLGGRHHLIGCLGVIDDPPAILLEWAAGGSLREHLYPLGLEQPALRFEADAVAAIGLQIGDALDWLHRNAVLHRDVKPSNVLVMADGSMRLADLSIAATGTPPRGLPDGWVEDDVGTLGYAAPELLRDPAAAHPGGDVYSLGATLYELLTGSLPFDMAPDETEAELRARIAGGEAPMPLSLREWTGSARLGAAIMRALEPDPGARFGSVADVLAELADPDA